MGIVTHFKASLMGPGIYLAQSYLMCVGRCERVVAAGLEGGAGLEPSVGCGALTVIFRRKPLCRWAAFDSDLSFLRGAFPLSCLVGSHPQALSLLGFARHAAVSMEEKE